MDIRFLKGLTPNVGYLFQKNITLSSTPAIDVISIGIGQLIKNHCIYVPVHGLNPSYQLKKVISQDGGSNEPIPSTSSNTDNLTSTISTAPELLELNRNGQNIEEPIKTSFQHPVIKTKTLILQKNKIGKKNYKFKVID